MGGIDPFHVTNAERWSAARRYAYPFIHSGIQFGMWMTHYYAQELCPFLARENISIAPDSMCANCCSCGRLRKTFKGALWEQQFRDGCQTWLGMGSPPSAPTSPR